MRTARIISVAVSTAILALGLAGCAPGDIPAPSSPVSGESTPSSEPDVDAGAVSHSSAEFDGEAWSSAFESASYFAGGSTMIDPSGKPYFQLALPSASSTDGRQLTVALFNFPGGTGEWQGIAEILLSSDEAMQGYQWDVPEQKTDFVFEITSWVPQDDGSVILSATYSGTLAGLIGSPPTVVTNGVITDLEVTVFADPF